MAQNPAVDFLIEGFLSSSKMAGRKGAIARAQLSVTTAWLEFLSKEQMRDDSMQFVMTGTTSAFATILATALGAPSDSTEVKLDLFLKQLRAQVLRSWKTDGICLTDD